LSRGNGESHWDCDYCGEGDSPSKGPVTKDEMGGHMHAECRRKFLNR
jgi:hypothetical protein